MIHVAFFFWHPLGQCSGTAGQVDACQSYNFWSGIFSDLTIFTGLLTALWLFLRRHNCHVHRCWRLSWHVNPTHGHPVCKRHHPDHPKGGGGLRALGHTPDVEGDDEEGMGTSRSWFG